MTIFKRVQVDTLPENRVNRRRPPNLRPAPKRKIFFDELYEDNDNKYARRYEDMYMGFVAYYAVKKFSESYGKRRKVESNKELDDDAIVNKMNLFTFQGNISSLNASEIFSQSMPKNVQVQGVKSADSKKQKKKFKIVSHQKPKKRRANAKLTQFEEISSHSSPQLDTEIASTSGYNSSQLGKTISHTSEQLMSKPEKVVKSCTKLDLPVNLKESTTCNRLGVNTHPVCEGGGPYVHTCNVFGPCKHSEECGRETLNNNSSKVAPTTYSPMRQDEPVHQVSSNNNENTDNNNNQSLWSFLIYRDKTKSTESTCSNECTPSLATSTTESMAKPQEIQEKDGDVRTSKSEIDNESIDENSLDSEDIDTDACIIM